MDTCPLITCLSVYSMDTCPIVRFVGTFNAIMSVTSYRDSTENFSFESFHILKRGPPAVARGSRDPRRTMDSRQVCRQRTKEI